MPLSSAVSIHPIEAKTGLARARLPEAFLVSLYRALAPYRGCAHGCIYSDGRAEKYYVEGDFARDISVRENLPEIIERDVSAGVGAREFGAICIGSGVTDVYQGVEAELGLTRKTLEILSETGLPLVILTKSDLIQRDFDVISRFPKAVVIFTATTVNAADAARLEPGASPPADRLAAVARAREAGFSSGIMAMPLCPGISDSDESLDSLLDAALAAGAEFAYPGGLTLRPGCQKDGFFELLDRSYPSLRPLYEELYRENRPSGMPLASLSGGFHSRLDAKVRGRGLSQMIPHRIYRDLLSPPDALFVLFCHMQTLYSYRGIDTRPLKAATDRYAAWLAEERTSLRRKRIPILSSDPFPITRILAERLSDRLSASPAASGAPSFLGNARLESLGREILEGGRYFDYPSLKIVKG